MATTVPARQPSPFLFVYGTLLSGYDGEQSRCLAKQATLLGSAKLAGRLFAVTWYPGLVESHEADEIVHGEVHRLHHPARSLVWLDAYEGLVPGTLHGREYDRVLRPVQLLGSAMVDAWVYFYRAGVDGCQPIPSGIWPYRRLG